MHYIGTAAGQRSIVLSRCQRAHFTPESFVTAIDEGPKMHNYLPIHLVDGCLMTGVIDIVLYSTNVHAAS